MKFYALIIVAIMRKYAKLKSNNYEKRARVIKKEK
jgi:hypothetical protein